MPRVLAYLVTNINFKTWKMRSLVLWKLWTTTELETLLQIFLKFCSILCLGVCGLIMSRIKDILKKAIPVLCVCNTVYINYVSRSQNLVMSSTDSGANHIAALVRCFTSSRGRMDHLSLWPLTRVWRLLDTLFCKYRTYSTEKSFLWNISSIFITGL